MLNAHCRSKILQSHKAIYTLWRIGIVDNAAPDVSRMGE